MLCNYKVAPLEGSVVPKICYPSKAINRFLNEKNIYSAVLTFGQVGGSRDAQQRGRLDKKGFSRASNLLQTATPQVSGFLISDVKHSVIMNGEVPVTWRCQQLFQSDPKLAVLMMMKMKMIMTMIKQPYVCMYQEKSSP